MLVFSILLAIGVGLSIAQGLGKMIPNPMDFLTLVYKPLNDVLAHFFEVKEPYGGDGMK